MMTAMWVVLSFVGAALIAALGDLVSEEIRGWLDLVPRGILRLASAQLDPTQRRSIYQDEWLPELCYALRGAESRPITRLILGTRLAFGLLIAARRISRRIADRHVVAVESTAALLPAKTELFLVDFANGSGKTVLVRTPEATIPIANGNEFKGPIDKAMLEELRRLGITHRYSQMQWVRLL